MRFGRLTIITICTEWRLQRVGASKYRPPHGGVHHNNFARRVESKHLPSVVGGRYLTVRVMSRSGNKNFSSVARRSPSSKQPTCSQLRSGASVSMPVFADSVVPTASSPGGGVRARERGTQHVTMRWTDRVGGHFLHCGYTGLSVLRLSETSTAKHGSPHKLKVRTPR